MPQLELQQTSPISQRLGPHGSRKAMSGSGAQYWRVQPEPTGAQIEQLSLQQYSPSPHHESPHGVSVVGAQ